MPDENPIAHRYRLLKPHLTASELRVWAAAEASTGGPEATAIVLRITGIPEAELDHALQELKARAKPDHRRSST